MAEAFGILRLRPEEFWDITPVEYACMVEGFSEERRRNELLSWRQTRWLGANIVNVVRGIAGVKGIDPRKLLPLPEDVPLEEEEIKVMSHERFEYLKNLWSKEVN